MPKTDREQTERLEIRISPDLKRRIAEMIPTQLRAAWIRQAIEDRLRLDKRKRDRANMT